MTINTLPWQTGTPLPPQPFGFGGGMDHGHQGHDRGPGNGWLQALRQQWQAGTAAPPDWWTAKQQWMQANRPQGPGGGRQMMEMMRQGTPPPWVAQRQAWMQANRPGATPATPAVPGVSPAVPAQPAQNYGPYNLQLMMR